MNNNSRYWHDAAKNVRFNGLAFIDGKYVSAASKAVFPNLSPIDDKFLTNIAQCDHEDVNKAVTAARRSYESGIWSKMAPKERKLRLAAFAQIIKDNTEELALLETLDTGKPIQDSLNLDIPFSVDCISYYAELTDKLNGEITPTEDSVMSIVTRQSLGVVGIIVPWNFPLLMASWKLGPALCAGNSVVLKPAEQSPLTAIKIASLAIEAGIPPGVLNVVPGFGEEAGKALGIHDDVDCIGFTGSTEIGKKMLIYAGQSNMKRVHLECGGKSPHIIFPDCPNLDVAASAAAIGIFYNQGEMCNAGSRLFVHSSIRDVFLEKVSQIGNKMKHGDPLDVNTKMGAVIDNKHLSQISKFVERGIAEGANVLMGGKSVSPIEGGCYFEPTILQDVTNDMEIAREEIFGPVLSVITFQSVDEVVRLANDTKYGLTAGVWSKDISTCLEVSKKIRAGVVFVNSYNSDDITVPFGGFKQSGFGRDRSIHAVDKYTDTKAIWIQS